MPNPEISVIIPTYQHGDTLAPCLASIFSQTFKDLEVVVVNDGSTDATDEVVKPFLDKIIYKKTPNAGAQITRNVGFDLSRGRFVIFCDADIVMKPTMLEKLHAALENDQTAAYAYCGFRFGWAHFRPEPFDAERLRRINYIHTTALIRRFDFPRFDESLKRFHDWDLWLTMLERGKTGIAVMETLFRPKPRRELKYAISQWLPKIFYSRFFDVLGIKLKAVARYREAAMVIRNKHHLPAYDFAPDNGPSWGWFLAVFALSALAFGHHWIGTIVSLIYLFITVKAASRRLIYGVGFMLAELIFGSLSGNTLALSLFGFTLSLRLALFAAVGVIWLVRLLQKRVRMPAYNLFVALVALLVMVGLGMLNGILHHLPFQAVFSDGNAYLALPMILFFYSAVENEDDQKLLVKILKNGAIALSIITILALYFFSHKFPNSWGVFAYKWLRDSRIAEVTALRGGIYRVFIQSQLYCLPAFIMAVFAEKRGQDPLLANKISIRGPVPIFLKRYAWGVLPAAALIISGSRSFALGLAVAVVVWLLLNSSSLNRGRVLMRTAKKIFLLLIGGAIIYGLFLFLIVPAPRSQTSFQDMLASRQLSSRDAATASRWSLLQKLDAKIMEAPILGSGFGTTVTYQSSDPRIIATTGGAYTTSAFEWNYHDIIIKIGLLGLLAYAYLLYVIFTFLNNAPPEKRLWLLPSFFALLALNAVSPFLNHPLGIGFLALLLALAVGKREDDIPVAAKETVKVNNPRVAAVPGLAMLKEE